MIKKEYIIPVVKVHKLELFSLMAGSDPDDPSKWTIDNGPGGDQNQDNDDEEGTR